MIAVPRFSLCVVDGPARLGWTNPADWQRALPDLQRLAIAGELRNQRIVPLLPQNLPRLWLPAMPKTPKAVDVMYRLFDCADVLNLNLGRTMLLLPECSARALAWRINWLEQKHLPAGTLWNVVPNTEQHAAVYRFELTLTRGPLVSYDNTNMRCEKPEP